MHTFAHISSTLRSSSSVIPTLPEVQTYCPAKGRVSLRSLRQKDSFLDLVGFFQCHLHRVSQLLVPNSLEITNAQNHNAHFVQCGCKHASSALLVLHAQPFRCSSNKQIQIFHLLFSSSFPTFLLSRPSNSPCRKLIPAPPRAACCSSHTCLNPTAWNLNLCVSLV